MNYSDRLHDGISMKLLANSHEVGYSSSFVFNQQQSVHIKVLKYFVPFLAKLYTFTFKFHSF